MTTWTKSDAACEQFDAAIGLLADKKFIAAHTLASAASELATAVARASGRKTNDAVFDEIVKRTAPDRLEEVRKALRRPQNFAKHADKDPEATIEVHPQFTVLRLFIGLLDLGIAFRRQSFRQVIFRTWFTARHPDYLTAGNEAYSGIAKALFGNVAESDLDDALDVLRAHLNEYDAEDLRARFEESMAGTEIDWEGSLKSWKYPD